MSKKAIASIVAILSVIAFTLFSFSNAFALQHEMNEGSASPAQPLTSAKKLCKEAKRSYKNEITSIKAKGLSLQIPPEEIKQMVQGVKDYRESICREAAGLPLSSAVSLCKQAKQSYKNDIASIKAKGLSLHISPEEIKQMTREVKAYRKKMCDAANREKKLKL